MLKVIALVTLLVCAHSATAAGIARTSISITATVLATPCDRYPDRRQKGCIEPQVSRRFEQPLVLAADGKVERLLEAPPIVVVTKVY